MKSDHSLSFTLYSLPPFRVTFKLSLPSLPLDPPPTLLPILLLGPLPPSFLPTPPPSFLNLLSIFPPPLPPGHRVNYRDTSTLQNLHAYVLHVQQYTYTFTSSYFFYESIILRSVAFPEKSKNSHMILRLEKKGKATYLSSPASLGKRAAQVGLKPATYQLLGRCSTN